MSFKIYLKDSYESERIVKCDQWDVSKQGFVVAYDKEMRSSIIKSPKEIFEPKMFIPRENILCVIPVEDKND